MSCRPLIPLILLATASGCADSTEPQFVTVMAIDTSGSATAHHKKMFQKAAEIIQTAPARQPFYLYRFDARPAEVFSEPPPSGQEHIAELLNSVMKHRTDVEGTNLAELLVIMNKRVASLGDRSVKVVIFTDCGTERMDTLAVESAKRIAETWSRQHSIHSVTFYGVADGHRETIRSLLEALGGKLEILR